MKHHFAPWIWITATSSLQGLASTAYQVGDASSVCTRCGVLVKVRKGQSTTLFWGNGKWVRKHPCTGKKS